VRIFNLFPPQLEISRAAVSMPSMPPLVNVFFTIRVEIALLS
jgi:hypothetical protein